MHRIRAVMGQFRDHSDIKAISLERKRRRYHGTAILGLVGVPGEPD